MCAWYNSSWSKRKAITLTGGASGAQTDYQVKLTVTWDSDMKSDFSDLRFTKADGTTLLDAWMESHTASTSAIIWIETDTPANTVDADIYMYYGNSGASSDWDGAATFKLFDDGELNTDGQSLSIGGWSVGAGTIEYDNARVYDGDISLLVKTAGTGAKKNFTVESDGSGSIEWDMYDNGSYYGALIVYDQSESEGALIGYYSSFSSTYYLGEWGTGYQALTDCPVRSVGWHKFRIDVAADGSIKFTVDGTTSSIAGSAGELDNFGRVWLRSVGNNDVWFDRVRVHKYASNPATYSVGSEESEGVVMAVFMHHYEQMRRN